MVKLLLNNLFLCLMKDFKRDFLDSPSAGSTQRCLTMHVANILYPSVQLMFSLFLYLLFSPRKAIKYPHIQSVAIFAQ